MASDTGPDATTSPATPPEERATPGGRDGSARRATAVEREQAENAGGPDSRRTKPVELTAEERSERVGLGPETNRAPDKTAPADTSESRYTPDELVRAAPALGASPQEMAGAIKLHEMGLREKNADATLPAEGLTQADAEKALKAFRERDMKRLEPGEPGGPPAR